MHACHAAAHMHARIRACRQLRTPARSCARACSYGLDHRTRVAAERDSTHIATQTKQHRHNTRAAVRRDVLFTCFSARIEKFGLCSIWHCPQSGKNQITQLPRCSILTSAGVARSFLLTAFLVRNSRRFAGGSVLALHSGWAECAAPLHARRLRARAVARHAAPCLAIHRRTRTHSRTHTRARARARTHAHAP
eukprot:3387626-Pleurochrysis_carterae.AAC.1